MSRAVRFDEYGGVDVLRVVEVDEPLAGVGEARVRVKAAGINPGEAKIRVGLFHDRWPTSFPSGQGSDLAGVVDAVGDGVDAVAIGDEVIGFTDDRASQAELVAVPADHLTRRPPSVPWEVAGSLFVAGTTAYAAVRSVGLQLRRHGGRVGGGRRRRIADGAVGEACGSHRGRPRQSRQP